MHWDKVVGQEQTKVFLQKTIKENRVSHAQIFNGKSGSGVLPLALAYATELISINNPSASARMQKLLHPDLHLYFPVADTKTSSKDDNIKRKDFRNSWRIFASENLYGNYYDWLTFLDIEKKQALINVKDAEDLVKEVSLKSYEAGFKVAIVWMAEKMNEVAANKLLKLIEEPPPKTVLILVVEEIEKIIPTIISRCQVVNVPTIQKIEFNVHINQNNINDLQADQLWFKTNGDLNKLQKILNENLVNEEFETYFISWVRNAFMVKTKLSSLKELTLWAETISQWSREKILQFIKYSLEIFRSALLQNYTSIDPAQIITSNEFNWKKFYKFIHGNNIVEIIEELDLAYLHIQRNANAKIVMLDTAIKTTRLLHKKIISE